MVVDLGTLLFQCARLAFRRSGRDVLHDELISNVKYHALTCWLMGAKLHPLGPYLAVGVSRMGTWPRRDLAKVRRGRFLFLLRSNPLLELISQPEQLPAAPEARSVRGEQPTFGTTDSVRGFLGR